MLTGYFSFKIRVRWSIHQSPWKWVHWSVLKKTLPQKQRSMQAPSTRKKKKPCCYVHHEVLLLLSVLLTRFHYMPALLPKHTVYPHYLWEASAAVFQGLASFLYVLYPTPPSANTYIKASPARGNWKRMSSPSSGCLNDKYLPIWYKRCQYECKANQKALLLFKSMGWQFS